MYRVVPYSDKNLLEELVNKYTSKKSIIDKWHYLFLVEYLGNEGLNAKSIVVEEEYISKDFFSDYSAYYSVCFKNYPKYCKRLHFFDKDYSEKSFEKIILSKTNDDNFDKSYVGFVVVKPLPFTIIGFTLLKNYPTGTPDTRREYFGSRNYSIHLFGYRLKMKSLAFQEQDNVLSACATTAIWTTLQKAAEIDYHITIKTPYEITKDAGLMSPDGGRLFPNKNGLSMFQMCQSLTSSGLVVEVRQLFDSDGKLEYISNSYLKKIVYAYSPIGMPIILIVEVPNGDSYGLHALSANGYKYKKTTPSKPKAEISWKADDIEKIFVHDDQWGPFARVEFGADNMLRTNWSEVKPTKAYAILIPVFPKIRLSYDDIEAISTGLDAMLTEAFNSMITHDFYWDIRVQFSEDYKDEIRKSDVIETIKSTIQFKSLPKYLWVASCNVGNTKVFDFLFDATEVANSMFMIDCIGFNPVVSRLFKKFMEKNPGFENIFNHPNRELFFTYLKNKL